MILAVDPGIHGALAVYLDGKIGVEDMPTYKAKAGARKTDRLFIDEPALVRIVTGAGLAGYTLVIESVGGIPGQSAPSAFNFGHGVGVVIGAALATGMRIERVASSTWKSALRVPADKRAARARASELIPDLAHMWPLQKHDGRAEASMLALYGHQILGSLA